MKKMIKNLSIVLVALILLSSCKKEEISPVTVKNSNRESVMFDYRGTYLQSRNINNLGHNLVCDSNSTVNGYIITEDSITLIVKEKSTKEIKILMKTAYDATLIDNNFEVYYDNVKWLEIKEGVDGYDLVIREYYSANSMGLIWIDHYLRKQ